MIVRQVTQGDGDHGRIEPVRLPVMSLPHILYESITVRSWKTISEDATATESTRPSGEIATYFRVSNSTQLRCIILKWAHRKQVYYL